MIEVYLFVNPLDKKCLAIEQKYLTIINKEPKKIQLRMIPFINPMVMNNYLIDNHISLHDLDCRNDLMTSIYSACLDCKAAYLQGRQTGRQFLFALQKRVDFKNNPYSKPVVQSILKDLNLDVSIFNADRNSDLVADFVTLDQRIANEMGIIRFSDSVIFNYNCDRDFGVLVDGDTPEHVIIDLFKTNQIKTHFSDEHDALHLYKKG